MFAVHVCTRICIFYTVVNYQNLPAIKVAIATVYQKAKRTAVYTMP